MRLAGANGADGSARGAAERVTTGPMRQPRRRRLRPSVLPRRPAPTMETVRAMPSDSITCSRATRWRILHVALVLERIAGIGRAVWFVQAIDLAVGALAIPALKDAAPLDDAQCPSVSILFAARDEAEKLPAALETFLALDYPRYEVVAVDDRSEDATETILKSAARRDARLKVLQSIPFPPGGSANRMRCRRRTSIPPANGWFSPMRTSISRPTCCAARSRWRKRNDGTT